MKQALLSIYLLLFYALPGIPQTIQEYTTAQAHSHNDYEQKRPFAEAYEQKFGSIEADLFLVEGKLYTAHNRADIAADRTFEILYLQPILDQVKKNNGHIYSEQNLTLQLLIDLKTSAEETLVALVRVLDPYKQIFAPTGSVKIVISGNTPAPEKFGQYPSYIFFDGRPEMVYKAEELERIGLVSQAFHRYSSWNGEGTLPRKDRKALLKVIGQTHQLNKKVRFWATPDNINTWKTMMALGVDYLNTDKVIEMGDYMRTAPR